MAMKIKDLADLLHVSSSTVSLVLNNRPGISQTMREKVFSTIKELGCEDMIPKDNGTITPSLRFVIYKKHGRIVSDTPFFSQLIEGIDAQAKRSGYNLLITYMSEEQGMEEQIKSTRQSPCEGMILLATEMEEKDLTPFLRMGTPLVVLDSYFADSEADCVVINNVQGAFDATDYLAKCGHRHIGYLQSSSRINNFEERYDGFCMALQKNRLQNDPDFTIKLDPTCEGAYHAMMNYLRFNSALPTAFFAENDIIALGAIRALKENGYRVPQDISVIGFDDMPLSEMAEPSLTTVKVPKQSMGWTAVRRLEEKIVDGYKNKDEILKIEVRTHLLRRESVQKLS